MYKKIQQIFSKAIIQRLFYLLGIVFWTLIWWFDDLNENPNQTLDFIWAIPTSLLLFQVIMNTKIIWAIILGLLTLYSTLLLALSIYGLFTGRMISPALLLFFLTATLVVYNLRPRRTDEIIHTS